MYISLVDPLINIRAIVSRRVQTRLNPQFGNVESLSLFFLASGRSGKVRQVSSSEADR